MNKFKKVSYEQYRKDIDGNHGLVYDRDIEEEYNDIMEPKRGTKLSAGYDFFAPFDFTLKPGESIKIPTGIRVFLDEDKVLICTPRSGLGFKYKLQLNNTVGIIDADYILSDNEGHIFLKLTNDTREAKTLDIKKGEGFAQGIIMQYFLTVDDESNGERNGGFGSTTK